METCEDNKKKAATSLSFLDEEWVREGKVLFSNLILVTKSIGTVFMIELKQIGHSSAF